MSSNRRLAGLLEVEIRFWEDAIRLSAGRETETAVARMRHALALARRRHRELLSEGVAGGGGPGDAEGRAEPLGEVIPLAPSRGH